MQIFDIAPAQNLPRWNERGEFAYEVPQVKPLWRGRTHFWAFVASIPLGLVLVAMMADRGAYRATSFIYAVAWTALFGFSALHHARLGTPRARPWMRWADHAAIYIAIAATYTPICFIGLPGARATPLLVVVWTAAIVGALCKLQFRARFRRPGGVLYIALGWLAVLVLPDFFARLPLTASLLLVIGGLLYSVGASVLYFRRPDPLPAIFGYHEVWHAFVVAAAACHYLTIAIALTT